MRRHILLLFFLVQAQLDLVLFEGFAIELLGVVPPELHLNRVVRRNRVLLRVNRVAVKGTRAAVQGAFLSARLLFQVLGLLLVNFQFDPSERVVADALLVDRLLVPRELSNVLLVDNADLFGYCLRFLLLPGWHVAAS